MRRRSILLKLVAALADAAETDPHLAGRVAVVIERLQLEARRLYPPEVQQLLAFHTNPHESELVQLVKLAASGHDALWILDAEHFAGRLPADEHKARRNAVLASLFRTPDPEPPSSHGVSVSATQGRPAGGTYVWRAGMELESPESDPHGQPYGYDPEQDHDERDGARKGDPRAQQGYREGDEAEGGYGQQGYDQQGYDQWYGAEGGDPYAQQGHVDRSTLLTGGRSALGSVAGAASLPPGWSRRPPDRTRWLVAGMPGRAPVLANVSLVVRICATPPTWSTVAAKLSMPADAGAEVSVLVQAPSTLRPLGPLEQVVSVPEAGDSDPLRFAFQARAPGLHRVRVMAFAGGTFLAELEVEVSVEPDGPTVDGTPTVAAIDAVQARRGEVTLQVRSDGDATVFQLLSDTCLFEPVIAQASASDPTAAVGRAIDTLRQLAQGRGPYAGGTARRWMQETGIGLWQAAVPGLIKEQYWQLRDNITSFTIATSHDVIPWELLYPLRPGADHGFLVEQFPMLRRVFGQRRAPALTLAPCTYVLSARTPENARQEIDAVTRILGVGDVVEELTELLDMIASGTCGSLHFVCHNSFDAGGSSIPMSGGPFVPGLLNTAATLRTLTTRNPLVFINACRTAGSIPEYGRMTGWAQQFMTAGAGAFLGTLWPVRSDSARAFAETCYTRLHDGAPLGDAVLEARRNASADDPDPTWLAYTAYGDPHAHTTP